MKQEKTKKINLRKCPREPFVRMYAPDGTLVVRTNMENKFNWVLLQVKNMGAEGYYILTEDDIRIDISSSGRLIHPKNFPVDKPRLPGDVSFHLGLKVDNKY